MPAAWGHRAPKQTEKPICIVDDDEGVADSLKTLFETCGFSVLSYSSGGEFLADERRRTAGFLVVDYQMPGMNGLDVFENLQKEGIRVPTVLISGRLDANTRERAARMGVGGIIEKPFAPGRLIELIQATLPEAD